MSRGQLSGTIRVEQVAVGVLHRPPRELQALEVLGAPCHTPCDVAGDAGDGVLVLVPLDDVDEAAGDDNVGAIRMYEIAAERQFHGSRRRYARSCR